VPGYCPASGKNGVLGGVILPGWGHFLPGNKKPQ